MTVANMVYLKCLFLMPNQKKVCLLSSDFPSEKSSQTKTQLSVYININNYKLTNETNLPFNFIHFSVIQCISNADIYQDFNWKNHSNRS